MNFLLNPGITIFGFTIYYYAIIIVTGMALAIFLMHYFMKRKALDPDDMYTYVLIMLPVAILSARLYFYLFPYEGQTSDWSTFFQFRNGGIAIYGGIIGGFLAILVTSLVKKQNTFDIIDCIIPGLLIAQAIGRWGNFVNQEAYGNLVTDPSLQWFPYAVFIENKGAWYQATFFYESFINLIGFIVLMLLIFKWKGMRRYFATAFYFLWYGMNRLIVESMRSDSLYFEFFGIKTGIKVSQLVSVCLLCLGVILLIVIYRKEIRRGLQKLFRRPVTPIPENWATEMRAFPLAWAMRVQEQKALAEEKADAEESKEKAGTEGSEENAPKVDRADAFVSEEKHSDASPDNENSDASAKVDVEIKNQLNEDFTYDCGYKDGDGYSLDGNSEPADDNAERKDNEK